MASKNAQKALNDALNDDRFTAKAGDFVVVKKASPKKKAAGGEKKASPKNGAQKK